MIAEPFVFLDPGPLIDGDLTLRLSGQEVPAVGSSYAPAYTFHMVGTDSVTEMGSISLRVGNSPHIVLYAGHLGYGVHPEHRGHHYAARACRLLVPLARAHELSPLWITCNPDNLASRRTCELLGAVFVDILNVPPDTDIYLRGERQKCRYRLDL